MTWLSDVAYRAGLERFTAVVEQVPDDGLRFPALDLFVHAWDQGRSVGVDVEIPADAVAFAHAALDPIPAAQLRGPGTFAGEVAAPADATPTEVFVAWTGRDPRWAAG